MSGGLTSWLKVTSLLPAVTGCASATRSPASAKSPSSFQSTQTLTKPAADALTVTWLTTGASVIGSGPVRMVGLG